MSRTKTHEEALRTDPTGPYAVGFKARKGVPSPYPPTDLRWAHDAYKDGQRAKDPRKRR